MKHSDIIVVGAGIAGLTAAITAAKNGSSVTVLSVGAGVLSIGSGTVDFLGYENDKRIIDNPYDHIVKLPVSHPYNIVGKDTVADAFSLFISLCKDNGLNMLPREDGKNKTVVSVAGTLRPTYISSPAGDASEIFNVDKIGIIGVELLKDFEPSLAVKQLKLYPKLANKQLEIHMLKSPFGKTHRALNCLDIARFVDKKEGQDWLFESLMALKGKFDMILIPPILGVLTHDEIYEKLKPIAPYISEMTSIPPGVGGFRIRESLYKTAKKLQINFSENCFVQRSVTDGTNCIKLVALHNNMAGALETEYFADNFIIATGGLLGGGVVASYGQVKEAIFGIDIESPSCIEDWSCTDVFDEHPFIAFGVKVGNNMKAIDKSGVELYSNVYFAGRTLGFYDFGKEKSGYGVGIATGYKAAMQALNKI